MTFIEHTCGDPTCTDLDHLVVKGEDGSEFHPVEPLTEARTIDEARLQMVDQLHRAVYGDSWARPESPVVIWYELLNRVSAARQAFRR